MGGASLGGNRVKVASVLDTRIRSTYIVSDAFNVTFDFNIVGAANSNNYQLAIRLISDSATRDYLFSVVKRNGGYAMYVQHVTPGTYSATWRYDVSAMTGIEFTSGKLQAYCSGTTIYFYYYVFFKIIFTGFCSFDICIFRDYIF